MQASARVDSSTTKRDEALLWPSIDNFYKALTQLLILHECTPTGPKPGKACVDWKATNAAGLNLPQLTKVPIKFARGYDDYKATFLNPLLTETLACLEQERDQGSSGGSSGTASLEVTLDTYGPLRALDDAEGTNIVRLTMKLPMSNAHLFKTEEDRRPDWGVVDGDLVVVSPAVMSSSSPWVVLGAVDSMETRKTGGQDQMLLHVHVCRYSPQCKVAKKGAWMSQDTFMEVIGPGKLLITPIGSLTTSIREYQALSSVPLLPAKTKQWLFDPNSVKPPITKAASSPLELPPTVPEPLQQHLRATLNDSQLKAVASICRGSSTNIHLLQGPPGTGKTKTVLSILSAILAGGMEQSALRNKGKPAKVVPGACFADDNGQKANAAGAKYGQKRVLVCAPSNAGVDEIIVRLKQQKLVGKDGRPFDPVVVRVGAPGGYGRQGSDRRSKLPQELEESSFDFQVSQLLRGKNRKPGKVQDIKESVLFNAHVVFATLSGAGSKTMVDTVLKSMSKERAVDEPIHFDALIVDEAAQAVEVSTLIPLKYQPDAMVLVGDPAQLEATLFAKGSQDCLYGQSLFQRLQRGGLPFTLLNIQYRMHPEISRFASEQFYTGLLQDAPQVTAESHFQPFHKLNEFRPFLFFNVENGREETKGGMEYSRELSLEKGGGGDHLYKTGSSYYNMAEVEFIVEIYTRLRKAFPDLDLRRRIGVIAPYRQQILELKKMLSNRGISQEDVEVSTVDGFQGREKAIIIFSCVRAPRKNDSSSKGAAEDHKTLRNGTTSIGFLSNWRRLNVAVTRGKYALWMVGHADTLRKVDEWKKLIDDFEKKSRIMTTDFMLRPPPQPHPHRHHLDNHKPKPSSSRPRSYERQPKRSRWESGQPSSSLPTPPPNYNPRQWESGQPSSSLPPPPPNYNPLLGPARPPPPSDYNPLLGPPSQPARHHHQRPDPYPSIPNCSFARGLPPPPSHHDSSMSYYSSPRSHHDGHHYSSSAPYDSHYDSSSRSPHHGHGHYSSTSIRPHKEGHYSLRPPHNPRHPYR